MYVRACTPFAASNIFQPSWFLQNVFKVNVTLLQKQLEVEFFKS